MQAAIITEFGGPEVLKIKPLEDPQPAAHEVLISVKAAGINRPDVFQRKGNYPAPPGVSNDIPGLEVSGIIKELGKDVQGLSVGDEVFALLAAGGYATEVCVAAELCIPKPINISFEEAACFPETLFTVWHNLFQRGNLKEGDQVLIHGGSGGIGTMAIQLAKLFGATVYTTVGSAEKAEFVKQLGADLIINYQEEDFEEVLKDKKINLILDSIGGSYFNKHIQLLEPDGRLIHINAVQGAKVELNLLKLMQKRIWISGSTLRSRDLNFKINLTFEIKNKILPLIESRKLVPAVTRVFPFEEVSAAHLFFDSPEQYGKIALKMDG